MNIELPYYLNIFGFNIHPHVFFDYLAIFVGYRLYKFLKTPQKILKEMLLVFFYL